VFSSKTGWFAAFAGVLGILASTDTLPIISTWASTTFGPHVGSIVGSTIAVTALIVAKLSHSTPTPPADATLTPPSNPAP